MLEESANIQEIIDVAQMLDKYGKKEAIDSGFIYRFRNKLSRENRKLVTVQKIDNSDDCVAAVYEFLQINDELKIASFENKSMHRNQSKSDSFPIKKNKKPSFSVCKAEHPTHMCSKLSALKDAKSKIDFLKNVTSA